VGEALVVTAKVLQRGLRGGGDRDDRGPPVVRVRGAGDPAVRLERVDQPGHRAGGDAEPLAQRPHHDRPRLRERPQHPAPREAHAVLPGAEVEQVGELRREPEEPPDDAHRQVRVTGIGADGTQGSLDIY